MDTGQVDLDTSRAIWGPVVSSEPGRQLSALTKYLSGYQCTSTQMSLGKGDNNINLPHIWCCQRHNLERTLFNPEIVNQQIKAILYTGQKSQWRDALKYSSAFRHWFCIITGFEQRRFCLAIIQLEMTCCPMFGQMMCIYISYVLTALSQNKDT